MTIAMMVLLTTSTLNNVWRPGLTSKGERSAVSLRHVSSATVYGAEEVDRKMYSENSSELDYESGGDGSDYTDDDQNNRDQQEHEDQLDQDDPGNFTYLI